MNISHSDLYRIILEEYAKEEGIEEALDPDKAAALIAWIKGKGPRPDWATDNLGTSGHGQAVHAPGDDSVDRAADTMPFPTDDMPQYDDEDVDDGGAYDPDAEAEASDAPADQGPIEDQIAALVQGMPPEEVSDLFQAVFMKIPGVEMGPPEDEEPETLYSPGAEGRPQMGFRLEELKQMIREVLAENV